jgi:hypothetical protein
MKTPVPNSQADYLQRARALASDPAANNDVIEAQVAALTSRAEELDQEIAREETRLANSRASPTRARSELRLGKLKQALESVEAARKELAAWPIQR